MTDTVLFYVVTAVAVSGVIFYLASSHARRLGAAPVKGTVLDLLEGTVRLRDVFRLAVAIEEEGIAFYGGLARRVNTPSVKALCSRLAAEEFSHKELFERQLGRWRALHTHKVLSSALLEHARKQGILIDPPGEGATEEAMAKFAIAQETKTAEFYLSFEKAFPQAWKRAHIQELVLEERRHEADLRAAYPNL